jgi:hypothetical protein
MGFWQETYVNGKVRDTFRNSFHHHQPLVTIWVESNANDSFDIFFFHTEIQKIKKIGTAISMILAKEIADDYLDYCGYDIIPDNLESLA